MLSSINQQQTLVHTGKIEGSTDSTIALYLHELVQSGYKSPTVASHGSILRMLAKRADLVNPESVRTYLAQAKASLGRKENIANVYSSFAKWRGIAWDKPRYQREDSLPKIPLEQWLLDVINASRSIQHTSTLRGLYETGCRVSEWCRLKAEDFDFYRKVVRIRAEKGSRSREARLSDQLILMVQQAIVKNPEQPFPNATAIKKSLIRRVQELAKTHGQPGYLAIHAHTFRHYRACSLYWQTKDILFVKEFLGHRSISSTMKYLQLAQSGGDESCIVKATTKPEEAIKLLEQGFTYSNSMEGGIALYRKRK